MRKGLVVVVAAGVAGTIAIGGLVLAGLGAVPAAAELVPGGWAEPIPVPPPQPPPAEPAAQRPLAPPPVVHAPVRRRVHHPVAPVSRPAPDGKVQF
jgi:hypothetical protein